MKKFKAWLRKANKNGLIASLALVVVALAETNAACTIWVFGQEDIPEELI